MTNNDYQTNFNFGAGNELGVQAASLDSGDVYLNTSTDDYRFNNPSLNEISFEPLVTSGHSASFDSSLVVSPSTDDLSSESISYLWPYYSNSFSLLQSYEIMKGYEKKYYMPSEELFRKWKMNTLNIRNSEINDWISIYLQIKDFIKKDESKDKS